MIKLSQLSLFIYAFLLCLMILFAYMYVYMYVQWCPLRPEEGVRYLELELQAVVSCLRWVLISKGGFSGRAANTLNDWHFLSGNRVSHISVSLWPNGTPSGAVSLPFSGSSGLKLSTLTIVMIYPTAHTLINVSHWLNPKAASGIPWISESSCVHLLNTGITGVNPTSRLCVPWDRTQGLMHARPALYKVTHGHSTQVPF